MMQFMVQTKITYATYLTALRVFIALVMISILFLDSYWQVLLLPLYIIGCLTDFLDGWVARKFAQQTDLGQFLDPVADKIFFFAGTLVLTYLLHDPWFMIMSFLIMIRYMINAIKQILTLS